MPVLPPEVTPTAFNTALAAWREAIGSDWVFTAPEDVALYRDAYSPFWGEPEERVASAAVAPATLEQVQAVVRVANTHRIPLYPISAGRNLAYGGAAPVYSGSVVLDLKRMNRVLEVNARNAYALVEPGVSYFDLHQHIQAAQLDVWIDTPDPGWGSLIGNALDGGAGWTAYPFRDHFAAHCGMEVVLASGDVVRTGMGALPGAQTWQQHRWGYGPWVDGLFRQSNFGIVTKMGFHLMPRPESVLTAEVTGARDADIVPLLDVLNLLESQHIINGTTLISSRGAPPASNPNAAWTIQLQIYGPERVVRAQLEHAREKFQGVGATVSPGDLIRTPPSPQDLARVRLVNFGIPNLSIFDMLGRSPGNPHPAGGHIGFSPVVPRTGEALLEFQRFYQEQLPRVSEGEDLNIPGPIFMTSWERALVCVTMFPIGRDISRNQKVRRAFEALVGLAARRGWGEYRAPAAFQDLVARTYAYNDHALTRLREVIKDAVDPNGILSAGRYGVWPRHLRKGDR